MREQRDRDRQASEVRQPVDLELVALLTLLGSSRATPARLRRVRVVAFPVVALMLLTVACGEDRDSPSRPVITGAVSADTTERARIVTTTPEPATTQVLEPDAVERAMVTRVIDGDTIDVEVGGVAERVRFILMDTPEISGRVECYGREASARTVALLPVGSDVTLERDVSERDRFGRLLRYVYLEDGRMLNELLVAEGFATVATFPPDVKYVDRFREAESAARVELRGLWSLCIESAIPRLAWSDRGAGCDPSYPTVCIPPFPPDLDCGEIPFRRFRVVGSDPHGFDRDRDGVGCES